MSPKQDKEALAKKKVLRRMLVSGALLLLALAGGVWSLLRHQEAVLIVTSRPDGAEVILNKRPTSLLTNAFMGGLPADSFIVSIRKDGHRPVPPEQGVRLSPNDTIRVTFLLARIDPEDDRELPRVTGRPYRWDWRCVRIESEPQGAEVVIDNTRTGLMTPANFLLEAGNHHLQAHWTGGAKAYKNLLIDPIETPPSVTLRPATYQKPITPTEDLQ